MLDILYNKKLASLKPRERKSTSFNDELDIIPASDFDGGTYRKPKLSRNETFTKKSQPSSYIFGDERQKSQSRETSYDLSDHSDDSERNLINKDDKVKEVMTWFVDVNPPSRPKPILGERRENYQSEKYTSHKNSPPKPLPRTSLVKRNDTFRVNEPIQVEIERKPSTKSNHPIRIEIRNPPPLSEREYEMSRPIGIATPYNNKILVNKRPTPTATLTSRSSTSSSSQYRDPRLTTPNRASQNDVTTAYNSFSQSRFDSIRRKFANSNDSQSQPRVTQTPRERLPTPSPPPKPSRMTIPRSSQQSYSNHSTAEPKSKTLTKPKKLQKLWTSFNNRVQPKKKNPEPSNSRYSYTSQVILQEEKKSPAYKEKLIPPPLKEKSAAVREKISFRERFSSQKDKSVAPQSTMASKEKSTKEKTLSITTPRKTNTTGSTFSWLMKVKTRK